MTSFTGVAIDFRDIVRNSQDADEVGLVPASVGRNERDRARPEKTEHRTKNVGVSDASSSGEVIHLHGKREAIDTIRICELSEAHNTDIRWCNSNATDGLRKPQRQVVFADSGNIIDCFCSPNRVGPVQDPSSWGTFVHCHSFKVLVILAQPR